MSCISVNGADDSASLSDDSGKSEKNITTNTYSIGELNELTASGVTVNITTGTPTGKLIVKAPGSIIDKIEVKYRNGKLSINDKRKRNRSNRAYAYITTGDIKEITATVGAKVILDKPLSTKGIDLTASTSASIKMPSLAVDGKCELTTSTAGKINIDYLTAGFLEAESSTGANIIISGGKVNSAVVGASTGGSVNCQKVVINTGSATASTGGHINCSIKQPKRISTSTGGSVNNDKSQRSS